MNYNKVSNLKFIDSANHYISCDVVFEKLGEMQFVAYKFDTEPHGKKIYQKAINGDFGPIEPYVEPETIILTGDDLAFNIRSERQIKLEELDKLTMNPLRWESFSVEQQNELREYRQQLLDITIQPTFPNSVVWPNIPSIIPVKLPIVMDPSKFVIM